MWEDKYKVWLEEAKDNMLVWNSAFIFQKKGSKIVSYSNYVCYAPINSDLPIEKLLVWEPYIEECEGYVNFLLNSKWLGHVFLTKDYMKGAAEGFEIDCSTPHNTLRGAIVTLRSCFEHPNIAKGFNLFKSWGYSDEVAFYFAIVLRGCFDQGAANITINRTGHGIDVDEHVFLGDIIEGKLHGQNQPANVCGYYMTEAQAEHLRKPISEITNGFTHTTDIGSIGNLNGSRLSFVNPEHKTYVGDIYVNHPEVKPNNNPWRSTWIVPNSHDNIKTLIDLYLKEYEIA